jgi:hypothetical protein
VSGFETILAVLAPEVIMVILEKPPCTR